MRNPSNESPVPVIFPLNCFFQSINNHTITSYFQENIHGSHPSWALSGLTPLFRIPSVGSAFGFHLNKCQVHFVFKTMVFLVSLVLYKRSLPALPSFIEDIISSSGTDQVCKKLKWYTSVLKKKKREREKFIHSPHSVNIHTHIFYPKMARCLNKELTQAYTLKNKETGK